MDLKEPVTTQEQLDKIVKDRLEREREKVRSEFSDYDDLKAKALKLDELEKSGSEELKKALAEVDNLKGELQTRDEHAKSQQMRKQVAKATGVPEDLIQGADEESMKTFAEAVAAFAKKPSAPIIPESGISTQAGETPAQKFGQFMAETFN